MPGSLGRAPSTKREVAMPQLVPPTPQGLWHLLPSQGPPLEGSNVLRKSSSSPTSGSQLAVAGTSAELYPESALTSLRFWSHH